MTEGLSLAAMTETPVVIALAQRPAPATGLPTKTEQADLFFALHAGHGEFPRFIFAPGDPEEAFRLTVKAFDLSQKYQVPALILSDQYLADSQWTHDGLPLDGLPQKDYRVRADGIDSLETYARHAFTATGISPFAVPGKTRHVVVTDSDEHTEGGHITEDAGLRTRMVEKRLFLKLDAMRLEMAPPALYGPEDAETVLLCWGSTVGVVREAARALADRKVSVLHFSEIWPFPGTDAFDYLAVLKKAKRTIAIEMNATGQFARLVKNETGFAVSDRVLRYDGRPYMLEELVEELRGRT